MNEAQIGPDLLADFGLLESAVPRRRSSVRRHPDTAAALMHGFVPNHPFIDGNMRRALVAAHR
ncbi:MAG: Fic family protein [Candidatus Methylomirabilaceae bacterium]